MYYYNSIWFFQKFYIHNFLAFTGCWPREENVSSSNLYSGWAYTAVAVNKTIYLNGSLKRGEFNSSYQFEFESTIFKVTGNDLYCLVLLVNGSVWKLCVQTLEKPMLLQFLSTEKESSTIISRRNPIFAESSSLNDDNVEPTESVKDIGCCQTFSVALTSMNNLYVIPSKIYGFARHIRVTKLCCGYEHCLLLTANGDVYVFGSSR